MKKKHKIILIVFFILCISIIGIILYSKNSTIEIPDNPNLKISIDYMSAPSLTITYYFYDDSIIRTSYCGGVLSSGPVSSTSTTKYYFTEAIDLSELKNFINSIPIDTTDMKLVEITEKDGTSYYIDDLSVSDKETSGLTLAHGELLTEITKITDKSFYK